MENTERQLLLKVIKSNHQLKKLYEEHISLEEQLSQYEHRTFLTSLEAIQEKKLKFQKLQGKEQMMDILSTYRAA